MGSTSTSSGDRGQRIALWGLFGQKNIGNEFTLEAVVHNIRERLPEAELFIVCTNPEDASCRYDLPAFAISAPYRSNHGTDQPRQRSNRIAKLIRILFRRIPTEVAGWMKAFRILKNVNLLAMPGTGLLTDYASSALGYPYEILKWSLIARIRGCRVRIVSVGVGPLRQSLSRLFIRTALRLADYRSFRDSVSKSRIEGSGAKVKADPIAPDLAFSLPKSLVETAYPGKDKKRYPVFGSGVMDYVGEFGIMQDDGAIYTN